MRPGDLGGLGRLAAAAAEAAEARLSALRREEADLRRRIAALDEARRTRAAEARATEVSLRAGVDLRWERWIECRTSALSTELARLLARIEMARDDLARALGRRIATEALAERARLSAAARRSRAEERGV